MKSQNNNLLRQLQSFMTDVSANDSQTVLKKMQQSLDYLQEKIKIYEELLTEATGEDKPILSDKQKRRLAHAGKKLDDFSLFSVENTFSPETIRSWHRELVGRKYDSSKVRPENKRGPKPISREIVDTVLRIAESNSDWGYRRLAAYMEYLGYNIAASTVKSILDDHGIVPDPERRSNGDWDLFFSSHHGLILSSDAAQIEVLTQQGLERHHILFFEDIFTREVWLGGICKEVNGEWLEELTQRLVDDKNSYLHGMKYLIHDRGTFFTRRFHKILKKAGVKGKNLPARSPNLNAHIESFIKSYKKECAEKFIFTSTAQLQYCTTEYLEWYNHERPHRGLGGKMIHPHPQDKDGEIIEFSRLGGLLKSYRRVKQAA